MHVFSVLQIFLQMLPGTIQALNEEGLSNRRYLQLWMSIDWERCSFLQSEAPKYGWSETSNYFLLK